MDRRSFIRNTSLGLGAAGNTKLEGWNISVLDSLYKPEVENDHILVIIQLFGGNDGLNTIVPYESDDYYKWFRSKLAIPKASTLPIGDKGLGNAMNPMLRKGIKDGMLGLFNAGKLAILQGVGYPNPNLSHFRSTDIWFAGITPQNDTELLGTGWLGRYFDSYNASKLPDSPYSIHVGDTPLLLFQGENEEKAIVLENIDDFLAQAENVSGEKVEILEDSIFKGEFDHINNIGLKVNHYSSGIKNAYNAGRNMENYADESISNQLKLVAKLIDGGLKTKVYSVSLGGFDTHGGQGVLDGQHANLLRQLSEAMASFQSDIEKLGHSNRVLGITISEFGRRPYENASLGTDHGTANVMFAFGDEVKPKIFGSNLVSLPFLDNENISHRYDFRSIYQEILRTWLGASSFLTEKLLGGKYSYVENEGFLKSTQKDLSLPAQPVVAQVVHDPQSHNNPNYVDPRTVTEQDVFRLSPNPSIDGNMQLAMILYLENKVTISQVSLNGTEYGELHSGNYKIGSYILPLQLRGGSGFYILKIRVGNRNHVLKAIKL